MSELEKQAITFVEKYIEMLQGVIINMNKNIDEHISKLIEFLQEDSERATELWLKLQYNDIAYNIEDVLGITVYGENIIG